VAVAAADELAGQRAHRAQVIATYCDVLERP
jgi:hypothetical protein